jgi:hypothetical protein
MKGGQKKMRATQKKSLFPQRPAVAIARPIAGAIVSALIGPAAGAWIAWMGLMR